MRLLCQQPGQGQLRRGAAHLAGQLQVAGQQLQVALVVFRIEARHAVANVGGFQLRLGVRELAGEKAPRQWAEGHEGDVERHAGFQHGNLCIAAPQRVLGLQGRDGMHALRPLQGIG